MRVLVAIGQDFQDLTLLSETLNSLHSQRGISILLRCDDDDADRPLFDWAMSAGIPARCYPADWTKYGRAAVRIRNKQLIQDRPDLLIVFHGSKLPASLIRRARKAKIEVVMVERR